MADDYRFFPASRVTVVDNISQTIQDAPGTVVIGQNAGEIHLMAARTQPIRKRVQGHITRKKTWNQEDRPAVRSSAAPAPSPRVTSKPCEFSNCTELPQQ